MNVVSIDKGKDDVAGNCHDNIIWDNDEGNDNADNKNMPCPLPLNVVRFEDSAVVPPVVPPSPNTAEAPRQTRNLSPPPAPGAL